VPSQSTSGIFIEAQLPRFEYLLGFHVCASTIRVVEQGLVPRRNIGRAAVVFILSPLNPDWKIDLSRVAIAIVIENTNAFNISN
jgi:hypothetical protein